MKVIPLGYAHPDTEQIVKHLLNNEQHWIIVDIRLNNVSSRWFGQWNGKALRISYPGRYLHIPELGNLNHKDRSKGIQIADAQTGIEKLRRELRNHHLILLCACKHYDTCHRKVVVDLLREAVPEIEIVQL